MQIIYKPQAAGKTTRMMAWLKKDVKHIFVTFSRTEKERLLKQYCKDELEAGQPLPDWSSRIITWQELTQKGSSMTSGQILGIDNADLVLEQIFHRPISIISLTAPTPEERV